MATKLSFFRDIVDLIFQLKYAIQHTNKEFKNDHLKTNKTCDEISKKKFRSVA